MQRLSSLTARAAGAALVGLAVVTAARWALPWEAIAQLVPGSRNVGPANPILFTAAGFSILAAANAFRGRWVLRTRIVAIALLLLLPMLHLAETLWGFYVAFDSTRPPGTVGAALQGPGRLSPNSSIAFVGAGLAFWLYLRQPTKAATFIYLSLTVLIGLIGFAGFFGHFLGLETLYQFANYNRLLPATALGFIVLSGGLWFMHEMTQKFDLRDAPSRIQRRSTVVVTLLCISASVIGFSTMRDTFEEGIAANIRQTTVQNATSITHSLEVSLWYPKTLATRPLVQQSLSSLDKQPGDTAATATLINIAASFLQVGMSNAQFFDAQGQLVASAGEPMRAKAKVLHTLHNTGNTTTLAWYSEGYVLLSDNLVVVNGATVGRLRTEQPMQLVNRLLQQMRTANETADAIFCSKEDDEAVCAETRLRQPSFRLPLANAEGRAAHGVGLALAGETGVLAAKDARNKDVLTAFAPVGAYGLALGYKTDLDTLYAPLRKRLAALAGSMLLLIGLGIFAFRSQVQPVLNRLAESERKLKAILDEQDEMVSLATPDGRLTYVNPSYARHFGLQVHQLIGTNLLDHVYPADRDIVADKIARVIATGVAIKSENRMQRSDDSPRWVSWTNSLQLGREGEALLHSVGRDVTERRAAEDALRASEAILERTGTVAGVGGWELDLRTSHLYWTKQTRAIHEVSDDFVPTLESAVAFYTPEARDEIARAVDHGSKTGQPWDLELPLRTARGREICVRAQGQAVYENGDVVRLVGAFQDVTSRKALETSLRELTTIFDKTTDYVIQTDWRGDITYLNPAARRILGMRPDDGLAGLRFSDFNTLETNRDIAEVIIPAVKENGIWVGETIFKAGNGRLVPVTHMVIGHREGHGRISRYSGIMRDITEERARKREQQQQASTLRSITEAIPGFVAVVDSDRRYRFVNTGFERWVGKTRDKIIGRTVAEILGEDDYKQSEEYLERALRGESLSFERDYASATAVSHLAVSYIPMFNDANEVEGFIGIGQDITSHRQEQVRLLKLSQRDALTGLLNRAGFEEFLDEWQTAPGSSGAIALLYIDLDHFKAVNDTHGHPVGDKLLQQFAQRLLGTVRPTDAVARIGGDEFAIVLSGIREEANARLVADKVLAAATTPFVVDSLPLQVGASVGISYGFDAVSGWRGMVAAADAKLYEAKAAGRGRVI